jgi:hypothetical protein
VRVASENIIPANSPRNIVFSDYEAAPHFSYHRLHMNSGRQRQ